MTYQEREQTVIDAGLLEHYRRSPIVYAGVKVFLSGEIEWEDLMLDLVKKLAVRNSELEQNAYGRFSVLQRSLLITRPFRLFEPV